MIIAFLVKVLFRGFICTTSFENNYKGIILTFCQLLTRVTAYFSQDKVVRECLYQW